MLFDVRASACPRPILLSSPHSGRLYPERLMAAMRLSLAQLRPLDDGPVDVLLTPVIERCAGLVAPLLPRAWIDLNRAEYELDAREIDGALPFVLRQTAKVRAGLGLVPTRVGGLAVFKQRLEASEIEERLRLAYRPFHAALARELEALRARHGVAVLIDCHSMPRASVAHLAGGQLGGKVPDIVIGDRHGASAAPALTGCVVRELEARGFSVAVNRPFAGGHITASLGRPAAGVHALQLELRRDLFLDEADYRLHRGAGPLGAALAEVVTALGMETLKQVGRPVAA